MTEQNRPRHSQGSGQDPYDTSGDAGDHDAHARGVDDNYDDAYAYPGEAGGAGAVGAAGASGAVDGKPEKPGPPLRGLAMILTAVAVVLILWGAWSVISGGDDDSDDTAAPSASSGNSSSDAPTATSGTDSTDGAASPSAPAGDTSGEATGDAPATPSGDADPSGGEDAGAEGQIDKAGTSVTVLNNSTSPVARPTADQLRGDGWATVGYGNLQGRIEGISEESRVYYRDGDASAKAAAEDIAAALGISAVPGNDDYYARFGEAAIREGGRADGVVVVLTGPLQ